MAEETIDKAIKSGILEKKKCVTRNFSFYSNGNTPSSERLRIYGSNAFQMVDLIKAHPELGESIHAKLPYTKAEIVWICRNEMPVTLEDMLARRTRALILDARASAEAGPVVAALMAKELGFSKSWQEYEISKYNDLIKIYT
jgi:glycerol-3-phosphate dehydrogenase